ncbi:outer membrane protein [Neokomagataea tanensis NBRC 106556]|uniref:Outer membrane protein n=1 Tax=Neokomagataea tanensis NBRC 106556 TaxID=1223519 RepID=A0ABQ0QJT0_9PROT|nr:outer membrane protein [Neokomagataea tanensis NBRC 106556]
MSIADSNGNIISGYSIQLSSASQKQFIEGTVFSIQQSSNQYDNNRDQVIVCFLADSLIKTPNGNKSVEKIILGDKVITYADGVEVTRPITWVGKSTCHVRPHLPEDEAGYPVRILKGAIAENVPFKDLLITAEHCLFFEGKFVPARLLVNGRSIFYDHSFTSYDYYHIETEEHSVVMADGMLTESYLDTGNRRSFRQQGDVVSIGHSRQMTWNKDSAAPLEVSRTFVEPLFRVLEKRANKVGYDIQSEPRPLTYESDLHLVTGSGTVIRSTRRQNGWVVFMIPERIETIYLVSNASRPCDVIGPFVDDRRYFGVAVGDITLFTAERAFAIDTHLTDADLDGWNSLENDSTRWTTGNARLPISHSAHSGPALLSIRITQEGPYITTEISPENHALKA